MTSPTFILSPDNLVLGDALEARIAKLAKSLRENGVKPLEGSGITDGFKAKIYAFAVAQNLVRHPDLSPDVKLITNVDWEVIFAAINSEFREGSWEGTNLPEGHAAVARFIDAVVTGVYPGNAVFDVVPVEEVAPVAPEQQAIPPTAAPPASLPSEPPQSVNFLDIAIPAAARGIPVVPLRAKTKVAFLDKWQDLATTDLSQIQAWGADYPNSNCGCVARAKLGEVWFLEVDSNEVVPRIEAETGQKMPKTYRVRSRPGRGHYYFRQSAASIAMGNLAQGFVKHEDFSVRVDREYVVSAGSLHPISGKLYEVVSDAEIVEARQWLIDWLIAQKLDKKSVVDSGGPILEGQRDIVLASIAGKMRNAGLNAEEIEAALGRINQERCPKPHSDADIHRIAQSYGKYPTDPAKPNMILGGKPIYDVDSASASPPVIIATEGPNDEFEDTEIVDEMSTAAIPPFDPTVMTGVCKKFVELVTKDTTMAPQFSFALIKAIIGEKMAGVTKFETTTTEPLYKVAAIAETGSGKGYPWERSRNTILEPQGNVFTDPMGLRFIEAIDSGAGLRDLFFKLAAEAPAGHKKRPTPVFLYVDEVKSLGDKAQPNRNPDVVNVIIELSNRHAISRTKSNRSGGQDTCPARLACYMCGQDGDVYAAAFPGTGKLGMQDRLYPEYGEPVEVGNTYPVDAAAGALLMTEINELNCDVTMTMEAAAKERLDEFWKSQEVEVRKKARWHEYLVMDAYLSAFADGRTEVTLDDMERAIRIATRQWIIRRACFKDSVPDRVGYYSMLVDRIIDKMEAQIAHGASLEKTALAFRDFEKKAHLERNHENATFYRGWQTRVYVRLAKIEILAGNGQRYEKYVPSIDSGCYSAPKAAAALKELADYQEAKRGEKGGK